MKRSVKTIIMLLVLLLLIGSYVGIQQYNQTTTASQETGRFSLVEKTAEDIQSLRWNRNSIDYHFTRESGAWQRVDVVAFPCNETALNAMTINLAKFTASKKLENVDNIAAYGLDEPQFSVTATWTDGTETTFHMGDVTPFSDGYYMHLSDQENTVYVTETSLFELFYKTMVELAQKETIPALENVTRMTIGADVDGTKRESSTTLNSADLWYDSRTGEALNSPDMDKLVDYVRNLSWSELSFPVATDEELALLKLDDQATTVTLYEGEEIAFTLHIGLEDGVNGLHYVRINDSRMVYTVDSSSVNNFLLITTNALYRRTLAATELGEMQQLSFAIGEEIWQYDISSREASAEIDAGSIVTVTLNGETADAVATGNLWSMFTGMTPSGRGTQSDASPLLTVTAVKEDVEHTFTFLPHDAENYLVQLSDGTVLLVPADEVDALIRTLKTIK